MAPLPPERLPGEGGAPNPPFARTGIDFAGPFQIKVSKRLVGKRYVVLFSCMLFRAVHLEITDSLESAQFKLAFARFVARRGRPDVVNSDNGTNLSAGEAELRKELEALDREDLRKLYPNIDWKFNPPGAPHFGGHFERKIRSMKEALCTVMTRPQSSLSEIEFYTLLTQVEATMNAQPLVEPSVDPADPNPITPGHFLGVAKEQRLLAPAWAEGGGEKSEKKMGVGAKPIGSGVVNVFKKLRTITACTQ